MGNIVAIVGRPNVGKSTLFNRLTGTRDAIVDEYSGVTRDRHYGKVIWGDKEFSIIDTGGYITNSDDIFEEEIRKQVDLAIEEADVVLFVVDVTSGVTDLDDAVAGILRRSKKKVYLMVNKVDNSERHFEADDFYSMGFDILHKVSSISGSGTGDLLDDIVADLGTEEEEEESDIPRIAIVGRPNVGKSSLTNALIGEDRNIVTDVPGTTRDAINTQYNKFGFDFVLCDTAGLRKKGKVHEDLEFYSVMRSVRAIENSDICLLLIDATRGVESQDMHVFNLIMKNSKGLVICVNKWDLVAKDTHTMKEYTQEVLERLGSFNDVPIIFTSVITKQRIHKVLETAMDVYQNRQRRIPTARLNEFVQEAIENYPPPSIKGKYIKIKYATQLPTRTPSFALFCNLPQYVRESYQRYIENRLRERFNFQGVPINVFFRRK